MTTAMAFYGYGSPDVLRDVDLGELDVGPGQVRVRVAATTTTCGPSARSRWLTVRG